MTFIINPYAFATAAPGDPYFGNVTSLLNIEDANGTTFTDTKGKVWTPSGNAQVVSNWTVFDGSGDFLDTANNPDFSFGTGDFTAEGFLQGTAKNAVLFEFRAPGEQGPVIYLKAATGTLGIFSNIGSVNNEINGTTDLSDNVEHHVAISRVSGQVHVCVDGVIQTRSANAQNLGTVGRYRIGASADSTLFWNGKMRGMRITKGVGRYSGAPGAGYTAPTWPLPTS